MSNIIVMAFSPRNIVGFLLKKGLEGRGWSRVPQDPPRLEKYYVVVVVWIGHCVLSSFYKLSER